MSPVASAQTLEERCIDTIRFLAVDGVQKANSGHPGMPMGAAAVAHTLFTRHLRFDPADPAWPDRDRFVLSAGHACMLLYSLLHLTGYDLTLDDLKAFRQWGSKTPGPPRVRAHRRRRDDHRPARPGLRQRRRHGRRRALPRRHVQRRRAGVMDHFTYVLAGDGDMMEGVSSEAASFAGHQKLGKLDRPLRRQPHHHRRLHRPRLHRGRLRALRGLRLARAEGRRRQRRRRHRRGHRRGQGRDRQAVADRRAHAHRLRLAQQAGQRRRRTAPRWAPTRSS